MKTDAKAKQLAALLKKIKAKKTPDEAPARDATTQLVVAFLQWQATRKQAETALEQILSTMVDLNELRVSHPDEIVDIIGEDYPYAQQRIIRMTQTLNQVFDREHGIVMNSLDAKNKKDQRIYLDSLHGITPYVAASVMLLTYGGHAMPVDDKLVALLQKEGVIEEDLTTPAEVEAWLLRQIKAGDTLDAHLLLQSWSDSLKEPAPRTPAPAPVPTPVAVAADADAAPTAEKAKPAKTTKKKKATRKKVAVKKKK